MNKEPVPIVPIRWSDGVLRLLDQRELPRVEQHVDCRTAAEVASAIRLMVVRGAPAIGISAAYGMALAALGGENYDTAEKTLSASRPTAVNLRWALRRCREVWTHTASAAALLADAHAMLAEDIAQNRRMGESGAALIAPGSRVLTHCNTGALATGGYGTALGVIRTAWQQQRLAEVFHTETRPWLQGSRLTAWELAHEGIPARMIADSAAAQLMNTVKIDWLIVGADRIAANGDTANKIGTYGLALAARHHGAKVMVVAPSSTFDLDIGDGTAIPIEEREHAELIRLGNASIAPDATLTFNPVFDVTPANLIDAIVTERGVALAPDTAKIAALLAGKKAQMNQA